MPFLAWTNQTPSERSRFASSHARNAAASGMIKVGTSSRAIRRPDCPLWSGYANARSEAVLGAAPTRPTVSTLREPGLLYDDLVRRDLVANVADDLKIVDVVGLSSGAVAVGQTRE